MRKTKIVCTLGPASNTYDTVKAMALAGMNVARFNFSHGDHDSHLAMFRVVSRVRSELHMPIATLLDTRGPEIRLRDFAAGAIMLNAGDSFTLTTRDVPGDQHIVSITHQSLPQDMQGHTRVLIDDGLVELAVEDITDTDIITRVVAPGKVSSRKGVNVPGVHLSLPYISDVDREDVRFGIRTGFDYVAASFVRSREDLLEMRRLLDENGGAHIRIIAKIENAEGVENIDDIIELADAVMIARGDMGVEIPFEDIPIIQKRIIKAATMAGKQVITATQMLESMVYSPRPTRAEITDVANAIFDGTSATMLSGETANGKHPVEAVRTMARLAVRAEEDIDYKKLFRERSDASFSDTVTDAISHATCLVALNLKAAAIITVTKSGGTAKMISRLRPEMPIIACTPEASTYRQLSLSWGVTPVTIGEERVTDALFQHAVDASRDTGLIKSGDLVVLTAGVPLAISGMTNLLKVVKVE
ncbi:MAG: pyruvate kinase [Clostridiales bacterium]|jgi:pyruvate kinase|nr:pyruvate kinase [Clostridiales bacterium]